MAVGSSEMRRNEEVNSIYRLVVDIIVNRESERERVNVI